MIQADTIVYEKSGVDACLAVLDGGQLREFEVFNENGAAEGNVYLGRIVKKVSLADDKTETNAQKVRNREHKSAEDKGANHTDDRAGGKSLSSSDECSEDGRKAVKQCNDDYHDGIPQEGMVRAKPGLCASEPLKTSRLT